MAEAVGVRNRKTGNVQIDREALSDFWTGTITVGRTAAKLSVVKHEIRKGIYLQVGKKPKGAVVSVGKTKTDAAIGFVISAGETSPLFYIDDLSKLWIISTKANTPITWIAF